MFVFKSFEDLDLIQSLSQVLCIRGMDLFDCITLFQSLMNYFLYRGIVPLPKQSLDLEVISEGRCWYAAHTLVKAKLD